MKTTIVYMAVQVVNRAENGTLIEWYDGDQRGSYKIALEDAKSAAEQFPGTSYVVVERTVKECSKVFIENVVAK